MRDESANPGGPTADATSALSLPAAVDRAAFQAELNRLRVREKAHPRRRRDRRGPAAPAHGRGRPRPRADRTRRAAHLLEAFEGRRQLIAYYFMWNVPGRPAAEQCEGCTWVTTQVTELSYLHSRDITYAVLCQGGYDESIRYRDFMGWDMPWYSA
jgi:predicted dithiol-disulfide oxidoreductase (DUF899 family)